MLTRRPRLRERKRAQFGQSAVVSGIPVQFHRFAAGTGTTLTAWGIELAQGELLPANLSGVSVWRDDTGEIPVYVATLGLWSDGSARSLYIQSSQTLTNGSPVTGRVKLTGGFTQARRSYVDDSANWSNNINTSNTPSNTLATWRATGLPEGVITPVDPVRLCSATSFGILTPLSTQVNFTTDGFTSQAVDTTFDTLYPTVEREMGASGLLEGGAVYERARVAWHKFCRTGDMLYFKDTCAYLSWRRTTYWYQGPASRLVDLPEWQQEQMSYLMLYLFKNDAKGKEQLDWRANSFVDETNWTYSAGGRQMATRIAWTVASIMSGNTNSALINTQLPKFTITGGATDHWYGNKIQFQGYAANGSNQAVSYSYMGALLMQRLIEMYYAIPAGANRTTIASRVHDGIGWFRANMLGETNATPSATGFIYNDVLNFYGPQSFAVNGSYTSGATTIQIRSLASGSIGSTVYAGARITIGGQTGTVTSDNNNASAGVWTLTLQAGGIAANASDGTAGSLSHVASEDPATTTQYARPDLFGFWTPVLAWDWAINNDTTSRDLAKEMYVTLARTPRDGSTGPYIGATGGSGVKQFQEVFHSSQQTPAVLALRS